MQTMKSTENIAEIFYEFLAEFNSAFPHHWARLRSYSAEVSYTRNFFILRSYATVVAFIDRQTGMCYDILRAVYGYTATSAQHIRKFAEDYYAHTVIHILSENQLKYSLQDE